MQQPFVRVWRPRAEAAAVTEIHFHRLNVQCGAGDFRVHADGDAFVGLNAQHEHVGLQRRGLFGGKEHRGWRFELDRDLRDLFGQAFAVAQVKGHARPAPVVEEQFQRDERLGARVGSDFRFVVVGDNLFPRDRAAVVLAAQGELLDLRGRNRTNRAQHFHLLVADVLGFQRDGRLHRHQREQLHHVVLHHVAQRARVVVIRAAPLDADGFGHGDLDVVDVFLVPQRLENLVGEPHRQDVLDGLLAEVMVDAEDLLLVEHARQHAIEFARCVEAAAKRFFDDDAL